MNTVTYAIITVPVAPVRKSANHRSEMTNQLLFGDAIKIIKQQDAIWLKVKSLYDGYTGWLTNHLVTFIDEATAVQHCHLLAPQNLTPITINNLSMQIPLGASLINYNGLNGVIGDQKYSFCGSPINTQKITNKAETLIDNTFNWLNAPYLWGGKTLLGVDCSGFSQMMYKLIGILLPRDAWQQAEQGEFVASLNKALPGDLAFFDDKDEIVHVGILLSSKKIIHAAGKVRIDNIDKKGVLSSAAGKRTHQLKLIKRYF